MKFNDLLSEYNQKLAYIKRMTTPDTLSFYHKTKEYWGGYLKSTFDWFQAIKLECDDYKPALRRITDAEARQYKYITRTDDNQEIEWPLCGILEYRQESIPVYVDDCGQQMFAVYKNHEIPGGSYNSCCEYDFCYAIDEIKDLEEA